MQITNNTYLSKLNTINTMRTNLRQAITVLSLVVILIVFWCLKLTGITMAGEAFCGMDEHIHGDSCPTGELICLMEETEGHVHAEICILRELCCEQAEVLPHVHGEECLQWELICPEDELEAHIHGDSCREEILLCAEEELEGHAHQEDCFATELICAETDPEHSHSDSCYETLLICEQEESEGHTHDEACFVLGEDWCCGLEETAGHAHTEECYVLVEDSFLCGLEETEGHGHTAECYYVGIGFGCGLTEAQGHIHTEECVTEETELGCGLAYTPAHIHTEECYIQLEICPLEEHIHVESCYSDIHADLEDEDDWEEELSELEQETSTGRMLAAVAQSQLGYGESERNFVVDHNGIRRGITRYGQWYGNPYGDWSAMFASFCLHYAGVEDLPSNAGPESMRQEWEAEDLYSPWDEHQPRVGDLVFLLYEEEADPDTIELLPLGAETHPLELEPLTLEAEMLFGEEEPEEADLLSLYAYENEAAGAVAIITEADEYGLIIIQGDVDGRVEERYLEYDDPSILGYGLVPERSPFVMMMSPRAAGQVLATTINYTSSTNLNNRNFILYTEYNGQYYAVSSTSGSGVAATTPAVPVTIVDGRVYSDAADTNSLFWRFTADGSNYGIRNQGTNRALHPGQNENGLIYDDAWPTRLASSNNGARFSHSSSDYGIYFNYNNGNPVFERRANRNNATVLYLAESMPTVTVWLDGTQGNLMSLRGSDLTSYAVVAGNTMTLPTEWRSPEKYEYTLRGWYNVANGAYYEPGEEIFVEENMLLYADWRATSYNIGQMNANVIETISTNSFITTHMFDYNSLFNTLSQNNDYNPANGGNSTTWTLVESGTVRNTGEETLNFVFVDHDGSGAISHPAQRNDENGEVYQVVTPGLYNEELAELLFDPDVDVIGKEYIGTGDYLFRYGDDPSDEEHYGYYYYDSKLNAAAYNQARERFYVYDYLERTNDSPGNGSYSDFLPLNSPYTNTNDNRVPTYTHNGQEGYVYDSRYDSDDNDPGNVHTDYALGMAIEMEFYLSSKPGTRDENGVLANQSTTGQDMVFEFSGDDDVWVLIDGELVLDIGGIHLVKGGYIDFSTGEVVVYGTENDTVSYRGSVTYLESGQHTLTMYYLERGASMSNFKLRFNLTTRYAMTLRKEDTLTTQLLNGAQFSIYTDAACTSPAQLWTSKSAYERGDSSTNVFTVRDGYAEMWGLAAGNTYYLKETRGPDAMQGVPAQGIIRMRLNNEGLPDYEILPDQGNLTAGYMVHGYKVNEDLQEAYLTITNTEPSEHPPVQVTVEKIWNDAENHDGDQVTVYLVANGIRIQEVVLSKANDWKHTWENLPSVDRNENPVVYRVQESTFPGYISTVTSANAVSSDKTIINASGFTNGETYLLYTNQGYIGSSSGETVRLNNDPTAVMNANDFLWTARLNSDGTLRLTNKSGKDLFYDSKSTFRAKASAVNVNLKYTNGRILFTVKGGSSWRPTYTDYYLGTLNNSNFFSAVTNATSALTIQPQMVVSAPPPPVPETDGEEPIRDFSIINTPVGDATVSLRVKKLWDTSGLDLSVEYEETGVRMDLLANGRDSGLSGVLNLRSNWSYTFIDLPKFDSNGDEIVYTVREAETNPIWRVEYGPVTSVNGSQTAYETTVTNVYRAIPMLPETGSVGRQAYIALGLSIMIGGLSWYSRERRREERRDRT